MRTKAPIALLFAVFSGGAVLAAEPEAMPAEDKKPKVEEALSPDPVQCYRLVGVVESVPIGQAVELCAGSIDSFKTVKCFQEAYRHPDDGGLGLPLGLAVDLCRAIPRE
jgi:hypothetical protein